MHANTTLPVVKSEAEAVIIGNALLEYCTPDTLAVVMLLEPFVRPPADSVSS